MEKYILQVHWLSIDEVKQYLCAGVAGSLNPSPVYSGIKYEVRANA